MTINISEAIIFGIIGLIQGIILTMSYYDKRELRKVVK